MVIRRGDEVSPEAPKDRRGPAGCEGLRTTAGVGAGPGLFGRFGASGETNPSVAAAKSVRTGDELDRLTELVGQGGGEEAMRQLKSAQCR